MSIIGENLMSSTSRVITPLALLVTYSRVRKTGNWKRIFKAYGLCGFFILAALALGCPAQAGTVPVNETPSGENVVGGAAVFTRPQPGQLTIRQVTPRTIIEWQSFNIGKNATTEFRQPGRSSLAVNRVVGSGEDPTRILGKLKANGTVVVLDHNGVVFDKGSSVDAGGIIASTGDISNASIISGDKKLVLRDFGDGEIEMHGAVNVADSGLAAFVAPHLSYDGLIRARLGRVELAAGGSAATIDLYGDDLISLAPGGEAQKVLIDQAGKIEAESGIIGITSESGKSFVDSVVNMSGIADASSIKRDGGKIILEGIHMNVAPHARLRVVSSEGKGGDINIKLHGKGKFDGQLTASGKDEGGNIIISRGNGITISSKAHLVADSRNGKGGALDIGAENGLSVIDGYLSSIGATGGGPINLENGDDPFRIGATARIMTEARNKGKGGDINVSSAEGIHDIYGHLVTRGVRGGGNIRVSSRAGINIHAGALLNSGAKADGSGGDIDLFVAEGELNYGGTALSEGRQKGGDIALNAGDVNLLSESILESRSSQGVGGNIRILANNTSLHGFVSSVGHTRGGELFLGNQDTLRIHEAGRIRSEGIGPNGKGGSIFLGGDANGIDGYVSANGKGGGGKVSVSATGGSSLEKNGVVTARATNKGKGGIIDFHVAPDNAFEGVLDVSGKDGGGKINIVYDERLLLRESVRLLAESVNSGKGGSISISDLGGYAVGLWLLEGSLLSVSGADGGGVVDLRNTNGSIFVIGDIRADAKQKGNGGRVNVDGDMIIFTGDISARGGKVSGNGGKVTLSTPNVALGSVDVSAPHGSEGEFVH